MSRIRRLLHEYPAQFWVLIAAAFIDRLGGALLFPFFTLYVTQKFNIEMTQVGIIFAFFSISSVVGSLLGGAISDRLGRKGMLLFGLITSALTSVLMGLVETLPLFLGVTLIVGLLANAGGPAQQAMVADLLPEDKRAEGFGILRVVVNLSFTIGPMVGGLLASQSYLLLFLADAVASLVTAAIVFVAIKETKPEVEETTEESVAQALGGYAVALRDVAFVGFIAASVLMVLVYMQMHTTLGVYLRDVHGLNESGYGYLLSLNAAMVVVLQFPITRWLSRYRPLAVMAAGTLLYALGFALFGFVSTYLLFLAAIAVITIGEMMVSPIGQSIVARMAPEKMRGRYMAAYGFSWVIPNAVGPFLAGLIMDNADPRWVWYGAGLVGLAAAAGYYALELKAGRWVWDTVEERLQILEKLEAGRLSAVEAESLLDGATDGAWAKLAPEQVERPQRFLRVRLSDPSSGAIGRDMRLPLPLVNFVLAVGGRLGPDLDALERPLFQELVARSAGEAEPERATTADKREVEVFLEEDE